MNDEVHNMFDHIEGIGGIIEYYGYPDLVISKMPMWITGDNKGMTLFTTGKFVPFVVDVDNRIFDVWECDYDGGRWIDYGEEVFNEYMSYKFNEAVHSSINS